MVIEYGEVKWMVEIKKDLKTSQGINSKKLGIQI